MNENSANSSRVDAACAEANQRITEIQKPKRELPAAWLRVEAAINGWAVFHTRRPDVGPVLPDLVFTDVFSLSDAIVNLLAPERGRENTAARIQKQAESWQAGKIKDLEHALELMTAGRDQDRTEHREAIAEFQTRLEAVTAAHSADIVNNFKSEESLLKGNERLKQQRNEARAEIHELRNAIAELRQDTFPQSLDVIRLTHELQAVTNERDAARENGDMNRRGRIEAENALRNAQIDAPGLRKENAFLHNENQELKKSSEDLRTIYNALVQESCHRLNRINDLEAELKASTSRNNARNNELIKQREHATKRWREDNRLAEQRLVRIRELESEISSLGKLLQGVPPAIGRVMACVDGQLYSVDDLCKIHSELKVSCQNLTSRVLNLEQNNIAYSQKLNDANANVKTAWKRGFDTGVEQYTKYVSAFSKEIAESIATNQNAS